MFASIAISRYLLYALLLALFSCVAYFSLYQLSESPPVWYDEGMILQLAENVAHHGVMGLQLAPGEYVSAGHVSTGFPVVFPVAASFYIFGVSIITARAVAVIFIFLLVIAGLYLLTRLQNKWYALSGAFFVATFPSLYGDGKSMLGEVPGLSFLLLFLFFLQKLEESDFKNVRYAILAGVFLGLTTVTKPLFLIVPVALGMVFLFRWRRTLSNVPALIWCSCAFSLPIIVWLATQFSFTDSATDILSFYANPYRLTHLTDVMAMNFMRFFTESTPLYTLGITACWAIALIIRKRKKQVISYAEVCAFLFTLLVMFAYLRTPGWYRYLFPADIVALFFLPFALKTIFALPLSYTARLKTYERPMVAVLLSLCILLQWYYLVFGSWIASTSQYQITSTLERTLGSLDSKTSIFVFDAPAVVPFLLYDTYTQYFSAGGAWVAGEDSLVSLKNGVPDVVIMSADAIPSAQKYLGHYTLPEGSDKYSILRHK